MKKLLLLLIIAPVFGFGQYVFNTNDELKTAVDFYIDNKSTATYIVKATDKSNNEEMTYKVVKN